MGHIVVTVVGDDRAGLVDAVAAPIAAHGGNWERSHMAELAGKFAGIVLVGVPDAAIDALTADLEAIEAQGLLTVAVERAAAPADPSGELPTRLALTLVGQDHTGIVHEVAHALAARGVSIEELTTEVVPAPMGGGTMFQASATLEAPAGVGLDEVQRSLEALAHDLMVDVDLEIDAPGADGANRGA